LEVVLTFKWLATVVRVTIELELAFLIELYPLLKVVWSVGWSLRVVLEALVTELDFRSPELVGLLIDEKLQVVLDFAAELLREEVDSEADVCRTFDLDILVKLERAVEVGFGAELDLAIRKLLDLEVDCEVTTLMRLGLREELANGLEGGVSLKLSMLLL
jgi:hypothetical protein